MVTWNGGAYGEYMVIADGFVKFRGTFHACQRWCLDITWAHDAFKELLIVRVVTDGKAL